MKALKIIGIAVLAVILVVLILGLVAPKKYAVERTITIDAPRALVFRQVQFWKNWQAWSPWAAMDTTMQVTYEGVDGTQGSLYRWDGKKAGSGEMANVGIKPGEQIDYHLKFLKPYESESDGYVKLSDVAEGTQVAWGFYGSSPFPWNILNLFMSMDKMIGKDFETGLGMLKQIVDQQVAEAAKYEIKEVDFPARVYAAIQKEVPFADIKTFYAESFTAIGSALAKALLPMAGAPSGIYYSYDEVNQVTNMAAAIPIPRPKNLGEIGTLQLPAARAYVIDYYGPYENMMSAYNAIDIFLAKHSLTPRMPMIEEYLTDPQVETDTGKWLTRIYFFVQ